MAKRAWLVTNPSSGSTSEVECEGVVAALDRAGVALAHRTDFPADPPPDADALQRAEVDLLVLYAGDGTINAALAAAGKWDGAILVLPGGTMNLLPLILHDGLDAPALAERALADERRVALPFVAAGEHRAFVAVILGPAGEWVHARERLREHRLRGVWRAITVAWQNTFRRSVRIAGAEALRGRYQAIFVQAHDGALRVDGIDARDWAAIAELGWSWMTGDWLAARAVTECAARAVRVLGLRPVRALLDGEPLHLPPGARLAPGVTAPRFLTTKEPA